jgi:nucleotidyltransferase/DNA polymerase involved in DNA repair
LHYSDYFSGPAEVHEAEVCPPTWHLVPGTYGKLTTPVEPPEAAEIKSQTAGCASWCQKAEAFGRTVTVKVKYADFQQATRSRSLTTPVSSQSVLHEISLALVRSVLPTEKGIRLVGVSVSNFERTESAQLDFAI